MHQSATASHQCDEKVKYGVLNCIRQHLLRTVKNRAVWWRLALVVGFFVMGDLISMSAIGFQDGLKAIAWDLVRFAFGLVVFACWVIGRCAFGRTPE